MSEFAITTQTLTANSAVAKLAGAMDGSGFDILEDQFNLLLESGTRAVVLDLSGLESVTSAGVGAFINMSTLLAGKGGGLVLAAARPDVMGVVEMLGVQEALKIAPSVDAARKLLPSPGS